jgi:hypothetical protein
MKFVIGLIIVVGLSLGVYQIHEYWGNFKDKPPASGTQRQAPPEVSGEQLPGLPRPLEGALQLAEQNGAAAMKEFLAAHGKEIKDPRLAWIQLDYVILAGTSDPGEARRVFRKVQGRLTSGSPVYNRMKQLEKTYE